MQLKPFFKKKTLPKKIIRVKKKELIKKKVINYK